MVVETNRRTTVRDLVEKGLIKAGTEVVCSWQTGTTTAVITEDGNIRLQDGREFSSPSTAGKAARGTVVNGWVAWKITKTGQSLSQIREEQ